MRRIYISGKVTGDSGYIEKFKEAEKKVRQQYKGCGVINPVAVVQAISAATKESMTYGECMEIDLCLLEMCDAIYLLPDWKESKGAIMEYHKARAMGYEILGRSV